MFRPNFVNYSNNNLMVWDWTVFQKLWDIKLPHNHQGPDSQRDTINFILKLS